MSAIELYGALLEKLGEGERTSVPTARREETLWGLWGLGSGFPAKVVQHEECLGPSLGLGLGLLLRQEPQELP